MGSGEESDNAVAISLPHLKGKPDRCLVDLHVVVADDDCSGLDLSSGEESGVQGGGFLADDMDLGADIAESFEFVR